MSLTPQSLASPNNPEAIRQFEAPSVEQPRRLGELLGLDKDRHASKAFPLTRVVVRAQIVGDCAITELEEHYRNPYRSPLDVVHTIPLPAEGAVTAFELRAGDRCVRGTCKRREEARAEFESAKLRGKSAAILETERDDLHTISLANVPRGKTVVVKMTVVERLRADDGRFEYRFPTTVSQKYVPGKARSHKGHGTEADTDRAPDASRLTPPILLDGGTELDFEIRLPANSTDISANIALTRAHDPAPARNDTIVLRPTMHSTCNRDIVVRSWTRTEQPIVRAYSDGSRTLVVVDPPVSRKPELEAPREAVFVLDHSGSMGGQRINAAKRALSAALQALTERDTFEIIAFNTSLTHFAKEPTLATRTNISRALQFLEKLTAGGGTEAVPALEQACIGRVAQGFVRTVLFLTDGDVANDDELLSISRRLDPATRLFAIGLGEAPSVALLSRLARLCGGTHLLLKDSDNIEAEVRRFAAALSGPMACGLTEVGARRSAHCDLFAGRSSVFFIEGHRTEIKVESVDGRFHGSTTVATSPINLGALWARERVQALEDRRIAEPTNTALIDDEIAQLGVTHQIQTRLTSFVAIDESSQETGEALEIVQPVDRVADAAHTTSLALYMSSGHASNAAYSVRDMNASAQTGGFGAAARRIVGQVRRSLIIRPSQAMVEVANAFLTDARSLIDAIPQEAWKDSTAWTPDRAAAAFFALCVLKYSVNDPAYIKAEAEFRKHLVLDPSPLLGSVIDEVHEHLYDGDATRALSAICRAMSIRDPKRLLHAWTSNA
jgi:Ca-activated chloride channel family protein